MRRIYAKAKNLPESLRSAWGIGDVWTWTAIDADSRIAGALRALGHAQKYATEAGRLQVGSDPACGPIGTCRQLDLVVRLKIQ